MSTSVDLNAYRRFFAEEIQMVSNLRTPGLVDALATVPRERFLPPGPWVVRGDADFMAPLRRTPSDDPRHVYHNVAIGIDPERMLFNGAPGLLSTGIDALGLDVGKRVLHIGTGAGYYTAVMAQTVGHMGHVCGIEVDSNLAKTAAANLATMHGSICARATAARRWTGCSMRSSSMPASRILNHSGCRHLHRAAASTCR